MVADATRGVKFVLKTELDPGAAKAFEAVEKRVADLQKSMNLTLRLEGRVNGVNGANGSNGRNGTGSPQGGGAAARQADRAARERERAAERAFRTEAKWSRMAEAAVEKRARADEQAAKRSANENAREAARVTRERQRELDRQIKADKKFWDEAIQQAQTGAKARADAITAAERSRAAGWGRLSSLGRESFTTNRKVNSGFEALSEMGRAAMPRDPFAEGLQRMQEARTGRTGFAGLGAAGAETQARLNNLRTIERRDAEERRRALESQKGQLREINSAAYDVAHAFGQVTRAAAQFGMVGQRDMAKVLDTIFAVEGGLNAVQGGMNAFRAISSIRKARAGMGAAGGAAKWASGLARMGGAAGGIGGAGSIGTAGGAGGIGLGTVGLAGAGVTALVAGAIGAGGTIADYNRGVGPGHVGGFWDTVGTKLANTSSSISGHGLRAFGGVEAAFNSPYGLTSRERELRTEGVLERTANSGLGSVLFGATGQHALLAMRSGRQERFTNEEIGNRARQRDLRNRKDAEILPMEIAQRQARSQFAEQRHGLRMAGIGARGENIAGQLGAAFGRQQTSHGELTGLQARRSAGEFVDPAQLARAVVEQAREEGRVTSLAGRQRSNLLTAQTRSDMRGQEIGQELTAARQRLSGSTSEEGKQQFSREVLDIEERLKKNEDERLSIAERIRQVGVEGAQRELALRQQTLEAAKQTADSLRGKRESARERFGRLNPMERRATIEAAKMLKAGIELQEPQLQLLRNSGYFEPELRARDLRKWEQEGGRDIERLSSMPDLINRAEAAEKQAIALDVKSHNEIAIKLDANTEAMAKALEERLSPIFKSIAENVVNALEERLTMAKGQDFSQAAERANAAGGP